MVNLSKKLKGVLKKSITVSLCAVMTVVAIPCMDIFADEVNSNDNEVITNNQKDLYAENFEETVDIDGINYTYKYYYNEDGDRSVLVSNDKNSTVETITYDDETSTFYSNDRKIAEVGTVNDETYDASDSIQPRGWKLMGTHSKYIKWYEGIVAGSVAVVIASAIGNIVSASAIITSCGMGVLGVIAAGSIGGTLYWTSWNYNTQSVMNFKHDWAFKTPNGERYGTFHAYYSYK